MPGYVYILANQKYGTLYIGVTSDLVTRVYDHRERRTPGFAWKYGCKRLVWHEEHDRIVDAIQREKSLKRWYRQWKIELIEGIQSKLGRFAEISEAPSQYPKSKTGIQDRSSGQARG